jgi:hypothetical protein
MLKAFLAWLIPGLRGVQLYWKALVTIQSCAALAVILFFVWPPFREICERLGEWKEQGGMLFSGVANVISGLLIPELFKWWLRPKNAPRPSALELFDSIFLFALLGVFIERFYHLQGVVFGNEPSILVVAVKIIVDQALYTPLIALPIVVLWFSWRENRYRIPLTNLTFRTFVQRDMQIYASNVAFWIPALCFVYALPGPLQFLLFLFLNAAWCIVLVFIARRQTAPSGAAWEG